jgi:hypothetical protein
VQPAADAREAALDQATEQFMLRVAAADNALEAGELFPSELLVIS